VGARAGAPKRVGPGRAEHFADWHGIAVLLKIYAYGIDGQSRRQQAHHQRPRHPGHRPESESSDEGDDDSEQAS
jgi:hypothetical protein